MEVNLPTELFEKILSYLSIEDKRKLRATNKSLANLIEIQPHKLTRKKLRTILTKLNPNINYDEDAFDYIFDIIFDFQANLSASNVDTILENKGLSPFITYERGTKTNLINQVIDKIIYNMVSIFTNENVDFVDLNTLFNILGNSFLNQLFKIPFENIYDEEVYDEEVYD